MAETIKRPTACVDLDGTILVYDGWRGVGKFGAVIPGAKEALIALKDQGWKIIIHTCRYEEEMIRHYLRSEGVPCDEVNHNSDIMAPASGEGKPFADVYFDDRDVCYYRGFVFEGFFAGYERDFRALYSADYCQLYNNLPGRGVRK